MYEFTSELIFLLIRSALFLHNARAHAFVVAVSLLTSFRRELPLEHHIFLYICIHVI